MKRMMIALLACALLLSACALAESRLSEAQMMYEDYEENQANQTVNDEATLQELEQMLLRARKNPVKLEGGTMNCTLLCTLRSGELYDIAVATDGRPYITDMTSGKSYQLEEEDQARLWEIFDLVQETMGYDAALVFDF